MKAVVIFSGGLDSTVLLTQAKREYEDVIALNFAYGSKHNSRERAAAHKICLKLGVTLVTYDLPTDAGFFKKSVIGEHIPFLDSNLLISGGKIPNGHYAADTMKSTIVPFRNGIMLALAIGFAESSGAGKVLLASHAGDHFIYPDCRPEFTYHMSAAARCGTLKGVSIAAHFAKMTKTYIIKRGIEINAPLHLTYSCYKGKEKHCGKCGTCNERIEAFQQAGYIDPVTYAIEIDWKEAKLYNPSGIKLPEPGSNESTQTR
jgi:7-cyano-7-deazaguanine synthase